MPDEATMRATLNVRLDAPLKARGDKVLHDHGISTSEAIRALWKELATTRTLPDFLERSQRADQAKQAKRSALENLAGIARGSLTNATDDELRELGMARYA